MDNSKQERKQLYALYLKQFFGRHFERKHMLQILSSFRTGLDVLETILSKFQILLDIRPSRKNRKSTHSSPSFFSSDVQRQGSGISQHLQNVYNRLETIFESIKERPQSQDHKQVQLNDKSMLNQCDDQLYQMLNKYQRDCKKEKQLRIKSQQKVKELNGAIDSLEDLNRELKEKVQNNEFTLDSISKQNKLFQSQLKSMKKELEMSEKELVELRSKVEEYYRMELEFDKAKSQITILELKITQAQSSLKLEKQKFKALDGIIKAKIEQKSAHWEQLVDRKLKEKDLFETSACKVIQNFAKTLNKENARLQNKP